MKRTILNLIAVAMMLFGWTVQAADESSGKAPLPAPQPAAETIATPAAAPVTTAPATTQTTPTPVKRAKLHKRAKAKQGRSHDLDLRYCLDLPTYIEIAQCAGE
jgi:hypothetical protein